MIPLWKSPGRRRHAIARDVPYFVYIQRFNARDVLVSQEEKIPVGLISPDGLKAVETAEESLLPLIQRILGETVYRTLLAETYADNYLYTDAHTSVYEKIYTELLPGDSYSRERSRSCISTPSMGRSTSGY